MLLVTGGTGLLGAHLLVDLAKQGEKIRVLFRHEHGKEAILKTFSFYSATPEKLFAQLEFVKGDVLDLFSLLDALKDVTHVYHCAALVSFAPKDANLMTRTNVEGTANVVNACLEMKVEKLCYVSSVAALGKTLNKDEVTEKTLWKASPENSIYSISKYSAEREVWRGVQEGLDAVIVNPSIILGPGDWAKGSSNLFRSAKKGMQFYTSGCTGFVDVRDVVKCMIHLMESKILNERFILNSENLSYRKFFELANSCFNKPVPQIKVSLGLSNLVWRLEKVRSFFVGSNPLITKETTQAAYRQTYFSNQKIRTAIGIDFIPISQSIRATCALLMR